MHKTNGSRTAVLLLLLVAALPGRPAFAQVDLSGSWSARYHEDQPERIPGPEIADYLGLPINEAARQWALSWDAARLSLQEHQCQVHTVAYIYRGPLQFRIWEERDPDTQALIAIKNYISTYEQTRTIWMDGRAHPPEYAPHTWQGFSTGEWEGDKLTVTTTHVKQGWHRRNGLPSSDKITLTEHFIRHGDYLTHISVVNDPVYLTEPLIKTQNFVLNLRPQEGGSWLWPCRYVVEVADRPRGDVPHYLPGENPFVNEFVNRFGIPPGAAMGGAETMYPEYRFEPGGPSRTSGVFPGTTAFAQPADVPQNQNFDGVEIHTLPVQGNVYMLAGAGGSGGNVTVQIGDEGVLVVDTQFAELSEKILAAIRRLTPKPIRYIVNTHVHADHVGGNENVARAGSTIAGGTVTGAIGAISAAQTTVIAHENVLNRMSAPTGRQPSTPFGAWPTDTFFNTEKELFFNGEAIQVFHQPAAHTDGDSMVFFRRSDVISTGDLFVTTSYPVIDLEQGGNINGIIEGLNRILDLVIPKDKQEGGTMVIPGHGRVSDEADVVEYRDMVTIIRDRIRAMINKGMTLDQVKAANPTLDYDPQYGSDTGSWTTEMFVEAVYRNLKP